MSDSYNGAGTCNSANHILFQPHTPVHYSWDQSGPCSFGLSKQGPGFLQLSHRVEVMPRQACPDVPSLGEGVTHCPRVPGGAGFASICYAIGETPSRPPCPVGFGAGSEHLLGLEEIGLWGRGRQFPLSPCSLVTHMTEFCRHWPALTSHSQAPREICRVWDEKTLDGLVWGSRVLENFSKVLPFPVLNLIPSSLPGFAILQLGLN